MGWKLLAQGNDACWEHMVVSVLQLRANYFAIQLNLTWSTGILLYICCYSYPSHCIQPSYRDFCEMSSHKSVCSVTCSQNIMQKFHHLKMEKIGSTFKCLSWQLCWSDHPNKIVKQTIIVFPEFIKSWLILLFSTTSEMKIGRSLLSVSFHNLFVWGYKHCKSKS